MTSPNSDLYVELSLASSSDMKQAINIIRAYVNEPISGLSDSIKREEPFVRYYLLASTFYDGWENLYKLVNGLRDHDVAISLAVNGKPEDLSFVEKLRIDMISIRRDDIY
jgi:hypothetical protein